MAGAGYETNKQPATTPAPPEADDTAHQRDRVVESRSPDTSGPAGLVPAGAVAVRPTPAQQASSPRLRSAHASHEGSAGRGGQAHRALATPLGGVMTHHPSQAQIFASEYTKDTAREMLDTIKATGKKAGRVSRIVLGVSMPHQIGFVLGLAPLHWAWDLRVCLESITLILGAVLIPVAVDYLILICIQVIAARGMARPVKRAAIYVMVFPIVVSGTVNVVAPAPIVMRVLFGVMVVLIPMAEGLRSFIRPDFAAMEAMESEVASQVAKPTRKLDPETAAERAHKARLTRESNRIARMTRGQRAAETRRRNAAAPVSPGEVPLEELNAGMAQ